MPLFPRIGRLSGSRAADCGRALLGGAALRIVRFAAFIFGFAAVAAPVVRVLGESAWRPGWSASSCGNAASSSCIRLR
jgi:hypothetical protein